MATLATPDEERSNGQYGMMVAQESNLQLRRAIWMKIWLLALQNTVRDRVGNTASTQGDGAPKAMVF